MIPPFAYKILLQLLSRLDTINCSQIIPIVLEYSQTHGSMSGQEIRDALLARLFGLSVLIRSGLVFRPPSSSTPVQPPSTPSDFGLLLPYRKHRHLLRLLQFQIGMLTVVIISWSIYVTASHMLLPQCCGGCEVQFPVHL